MPGFLFMGIVGFEETKSQIFGEELWSKFALI